MQYFIENTISEGRMFILYKARCGTKYVILKTTREKDAMFCEILRREYEIGKTLSNASVVSTIDFKEDTPVGPAIVLEYIDGVTLREYLLISRSLNQSKHPKGKANNVHILHDILSGIDYLHHRGILHNDIKPDNIIINSLGNARIIDFGLSYSYDSIYSGVIGGSEGYSAPEILNGSGHAGAASDIYSLGLIIRELFPKKYKKISAKCTQIDTSLRYQSISELKKAILLADSKPYLIASIIAIAIIAFLALLPTAKEIQTVHQEADYKAEATAFLDSAYQTTLERIEKLPYHETATGARNFYLKYYNDLYTTLPTEKRSAYDVVLSEQIVILDSLTKGLPTILTLPTEELDPIYQEVVQWGK
jgi:serine/threonine protein kinase